MSKEVESGDPQETDVLASDGGRQDGLLDDASRRTFLKRAALGGGSALLAGAASYGAARASIQGRVDPNGIEIDETVFKPKDQRDTVLTFIASHALLDKHPERNAQYNRLQNKDFDYRDSTQRMYSVPWDNSKPGYTQMDRALQKAGWHPLNIAGSRRSANLQPNTPLHSWDQSEKEEEQFQFDNAQHASTCIKSAARVFGAVKCGIAKRDRRFDYDPLYDIENEKELSWEEDFPFEPKSVIVMLVPMDYDCIATAPAWTADGTAADGYSKMGVLADQMAAFVRGLGYHAVSAGNDLGSSVAYGILAGLGEGGRNGALLAPGVGPRVRICKVYTDLDVCEYDVPHTWGMTEFCLTCGKCAEACPSDAIPLPSDGDTGGFGFEPSYEFSDEPGYTWNNQPGIKKFYSDAKKCYNFWVENGSGCAACVASCTFNEPDFWHHWFIMAITPFTPTPIHAAMAQAHPMFGYGHTNDPKRAVKFWTTGEGMRVNPDMKNNIGTSNRS